MSTAEDLLEAPGIGWYGKIPSSGDFVARQLPYWLIKALERWMLNGMTMLQQASADMLQRHYAVAPVWNFLLPAGLGFDGVLLGALAPSCDRVRRYFPVAAVMSLALPGFDTAQLDRAGPFYRQLGETLLAAVRHGYTPEHLDSLLGRAPAHWTDPPAPSCRSEILAVLDENGSGGPSLGWPDLSMYFDPLGAKSFWWTNQCDGSALQAHVHAGDLTGALFARLFGPQQGYLS